MISVRAPGRAGDPLAPRLLGRAGFGWSPGSAAELDRLGWDGWVEQQLQPAGIADPEADAWAERFPLARQDARSILVAFEGPARELRALTLARAVHSRRQLLERAVELWSDWFHVDQEHGECRVLKTIQDREVIRVHALGQFRTLLGAVARSGAMMEYLDNRASVAAAPNENFARELLELHTVGVGAFDESDVREAARCFTGWTIRPRADGRWGEFEFRADVHDDGPKSVLGLAIPAGGGITDGELVLDAAARHPATAQRVAARIAARFLGEDAPPRAIADIARVFHESGGDVRSMLRVVLRHDAFRDAEARGSRRFLRPFDLVAALLRATSARVEAFERLVEELAGLGHLPFAWPAPDGYPDRRSHWECGLVARWSFCQRLFAGGVRGVSIELLAPIAAEQPAELARRIDSALTGGRLSRDERAVLARRARELGAADPDALARLYALAACSPGVAEI